MNEHVEEKKTLSFPGAWLRSTLLSKGKTYTLLHREERSPTGKMYDDKMPS